MGDIDLFQNFPIQCKETLIPTRQCMMNMIGLKFLKNINAPELNVVFFVENFVYIL